jgi:acyl-coenzyme A thioesterase PaaI-like protein
MFVTRVDHEWGTPRRKTVTWYLMALRAATGDIEAHGEVLRIGRRVAFVEAHARNGKGELVGQATSSIAVLRPGGGRTS